MVSIPGAYVETPSLAVGRRGTAGVSWSDGNWIHASIARPGGRFGLPENASSYEYSYYSAIGFDARDRATVIWTGGEEDDLVLRAARVSKRGFGPPRTAASAPPGFSGFPFLEWQATVDPDGAPIAVWHPAPHEGSGQILAVTRGTRQVLASPDKATDTIVTHARLSVAPNGTALAAWVRAGNQRAAIEAAVRPPGGVFGPATAVSSGDDYATDPVVAIDGKGRGVVGWWSGGAVKAAAVEPTARFAPPRLVSLPGAASGYPAATTDGRGHSVLGWETSGSVIAAVFTPEAR